MTKLGIIGGAGPLASALLYETIIQNSLVLGRAIPEIILINFPFTRGLSLEEKKMNEKVIVDELNYCINLLLKMEVERAILACNTLHLFLKRLPHETIKFRYLPELVLEAARKNQHHRLLILGTENTRQSQLYQLPDIQTIYPSLKNQQLIDEIINRILEGKILENDSLLVSQVIEQTSLFKDFEGVVLGCTDFPVLHHRFPISS